MRLWYHDDFALGNTRQHAAHPRALLRGEKVIADLASDGLLVDGDVAPAPIAALEDLLRVHTLDYIETLTDPTILGRVLGMEGQRVDVDAVLGAQRRMVGATVAAAHAAVHDGSKFAANLGGGLHHAHRNRGGGFCALNDIAVATASLRSIGFDSPIAIVDLDAHHGDGTEAIFSGDDSVLTLSFHTAAWWEGASVASHNVELAPGTSDETYLDAVRNTVPGALKAHRPALIFYIAGSDVLKGDPLGDFRMSLEGVFLRDRFIIDLAKSLNAPLVLTFGGGYQNNAWQCYSNAIRYALSDADRVVPRPATDLRSYYRRIAKDLGPRELQTENAPLEFTEEDITGALRPDPAPQLVFGYYTQQGIEIALERYGLLERLRRLGFSDLVVEVDGVKSLLKIEGTKSGARHRVVELAVRLETLEHENLSTLKTLFIEWLLLQDPTRSFHQGRKRLPGQNHPGLGLAEEIQELLRRAARRLELDGVANKPSHFHNARLAWGDFCFLAPEAEGRFRAFQRLVSGIDLVEASAAIDSGRVVDSNGDAVFWEPSVQLLPTSARAREYFDSAAYEAQVLEHFDRWMARGLSLR